MKVGVIGAGPAGLTAAYQLARAGVEVDVYESAEAVGGLSRSLDLWGQRVDLGPHRFFCADPRVNALWLEVMGRDYSMVRRLTRIYYRGRFFSYPLRPLDALMKVGSVEAARCLLSFAREKAWPARSAPQDTFEAWVVSRFGRRLFEIFFKTYSEKLWGIPCNELDADFAAQRIKKFNLLDAVIHAFCAGRNKAQHKTLVEQFAYPHEGTGAVYRRMAEAVRQHGGHIHLNRPAERVLTKQGRAYAIALADGSVHPYAQIVSSMPLSLLVARLPEAPDSVKAAAVSLRFRNTILVYLRVEDTELFPDQWLYIQAGELQMGRLTNFRNWVPSLHGEAPSSILAAEYWANDGDALWRETPARFIELAKRELQRTGLVGAARIGDGYVHQIPWSYPVYRRGYRQALQPVEEYLSSVAGLQAIGRYGAFKYNNQDHSILMGMLAAENIVKGSGHRLWNVNTDYDSYQEGALITEAGLAPALPR